MTDQRNTPAYTIGEMRVLTMRGFDYFHVSGQTTMPEMRKAIDLQMEELDIAREEGGVCMAGPVGFIYRGDDPNAPFTLEVGFQVSPGTQPFGEAQVRHVDDWRCASVVYCGGMSHLLQANDALMKGMSDAKLQGFGEYREYYTYFEDMESPNNVTLVQLGIKE